MSLHLSLSILGTPPPPPPPPSVLLEIGADNFVTVCHVFPNNFLWAFINPPRGGWAI